MGDEPSENYPPVVVFDLDSTPGVVGAIASLGYQVLRVGIKGSLSCNYTATAASYYFAAHVSKTHNAEVKLQVPSAGSICRLGLLRSCCGFLHPVPTGLLL